LDIDGLGRKTVAQLVDRGLVRSLADLFVLTKPQLLSLEGFADRSATLLLEAIDRSKTVTLERFLMGLGIRQVGQHIARVLAREFRSLDGVMEADQARLQQVQEIGPEISASLASYFSEPQNRSVIGDLRDRGLVIVEVSGDGAGQTGLAGRTFVFTGGLQGFTREEAKRMVEEQGARVASSVSKKTSYLVAGEDPGSKLDQAKNLGVKVLNEQEFAELVKMKS
jgi:DNA ligase (NAD+)